MRQGKNSSGGSLREDRNGFPAQSSVLDEEALLQRVVRDYDIPQPQACRFLDRGAADIYRVTAARQRFYLKVYRPPYTRVQSESEARFIASLSDEGVPVVRAVPQKNGDYAHEVKASEGIRPILLFEEAPPPLPRVIDEFLCEKLGAALAWLHDSTDSLAPEYQLPTINCELAFDVRLPFTKAFLENPEYSYLKEVANRIRPQLEELPTESPNFGLCHADLVLSNVRLNGDGGITFFDFGNVAYTWRAYELAVVRWSLGNCDKQNLSQCWEAFLGGYASVRALPFGLHELLPALLILRQMMFLGGNCATLPLRLGTEPFEGNFMANGIAQIHQLDDEMRDSPNKRI